MRIAVLDTGKGKACGDRHPEEVRRSEEPCAFRRLDLPDALLVTHRVRFRAFAVSDCDSRPER